MIEAYRIGGWGMFPTTIFGFVLLLAAVQYARHPERRRLGVMIGLGVLTFLAGSLGFVTGVIKTLTHATDANAQAAVGALTAEGIGESLNNIGLALSLLIIATIAATIGAARAGRSHDAARADAAAPATP